MNDMIKSSINKYKLTNIHILKKTTNRCVLSAHSPLVGSVVLKVNQNIEELKQESQTLKTYNGKNFCHIYDVDFEQGLLLEECILPGTPLRNLNNLDQRLNIFCDLFLDLHVPPSHDSSAPTYLNWVQKISHFMQHQENYYHLAQHMKRAETLCQQLFDTYPQRLLLHGDLHHDNILLNQNGNYTLIDPKGVIGPTFFDIPRFILNEMGASNNETIMGLISNQSLQQINYILTYLSEKLNLEEKLLKQCFYIEACMAQCWNVEDNLNPSLEQVNFAYQLLTN